jgi:hypothetical protein
MTGVGLHWLHVVIWQGYPPEGPRAVRRWGLGKRGMGVALGSCNFVEGVCGTIHLKFQLVLVYNCRQMFSLHHSSLTSCPSTLVATVQCQRDLPCHPKGAGREPLAEIIFVTHSPARLGIALGIITDWTRRRLLQRLLICTYSMQCVNSSTAPSLSPDKSYHPRVRVEIS